MCGVGTIPFLGAKWFPDVFWVGGEVDPGAMAHVHENMGSLRRVMAKTDGFGITQTGAGASAIAWDCQALPLRDATVDVIVVDM